MNICVNHGEFGVTRIHLSSRGQWTHSARNYDWDFIAFGETASWVNINYFWAQNLNGETFMSAFS
jgi:hypothetical protein